MKGQHGPRDRLRNEKENLTELLEDIQAGRQSTFKYILAPPLEGELWWDVTQAKLEVDAGHVIALTTIGAEDLKEIAERNEYEEDHLGEVDFKYPGIGAPLVLPAGIIAEEPTLIYILIDGIHRAVKAHRAGKLFKAHLLSDDAARRCFFRGDEEFMPWHPKWERKASGRVQEEQEEAEEDDSEDA